MHEKYGHQITERLYRVLAVFAFQLKKLAEYVNLNDNILQQQRLPKLWNSKESSEKGA